MKRRNRTPDGSIPALSRHALRDIYLPRIERCLAALSERDIWWRPNGACNSVGNLVLHLEGNVRQWIISGLGGSRDVRQRDLEFSEKGPIARRVLILKFRRTIHEACQVIRQLSQRDLARAYSIQGFSVAGFRAVFHVAEHFSHHAGQIIYITKLRTGKDPAFTRLPTDKKKKKRKAVPAV